MMALIVWEKLFAALAFACINFVLPLGIDWFQTALQIFLGLVVTDIFFGRIVLYSAAGALFRLKESDNSFLEAAIYMSSLVISLVPATIASKEVRFALFTGAHFWNYLACYLIVTAAISSTLLVWWTKRGRSQANSQKMTWGGQ
jgi:hypothetical protein